MMNSKYFELKWCGEALRDQFLAKREGEVRLGERIHYRIANSDSWKEVRYHVLGIVEDLGPRLNGGFPGANKGFEAFISRFLNIQSNSFLSGTEVCLHGTVELNQEITIPLNEHIDDLDSLVTLWTKEVVAAGGIPIVIGGGHNNAFGLIQGTFEALKEQVAVTNLDPHADVRKTGQRHSGNPFSTAYEKGFLAKYSVLGLHQSYNNQFILDYLEEMRAWSSYFEDWIDEPGQFESDIDSVSRSYRFFPVGIELDMDAIAFMPSSAFTPSGVTVEQARYYIRKMAALKNVYYLHLPEAAPSTEADVKSVGKTLCYLVADFIKCNSNISE
jgi:formiminoglutamase